MRLWNSTTICLALATFAVTLFAVGCSGRGQIELLEARLRDQEDENENLRAKYQREHQELLAARKLNESLSQKIAQTSGQVLATDELERQYAVTGLKIQSLLTGGVDRDGEPGDDLVTVVVTPVDVRGKPVELPGTLQCVLLDPALPEEDQRIGLWNFDEESLASTWTKSLGSAGYRLELPWQSLPTSRELDLRIRMKSTHGDQFDAEGHVAVNPPEQPINR